MKDSHIRCLIAEDDNQHLEFLKGHISRHSTLVYVDACSDSNEIMPILKRQLEQGEAIDLLFLDIDLDDGENAGMEFLKKYNGYPEIPDTIITTSNAKDYAIEGYRIEKLKNFLVKPIYNDDFLKAINAILHSYKNNNTFKVESNQNFLMIRFKNKKTDSYLLSKLLMEEILYISTIQQEDGESQKKIPNEIKIFTTDKNQNEFILLRSLEKIQKDLPADFIRVNQSYIINQNHIKYIHSGYKFLILKHFDKDIPIGDSYRDNLPDEFLNLNGV